MLTLTLFYLKRSRTFMFTFTLIYFEQAKPTWVNLSPWPLIKAKQRNDKSHAPPRSAASAGEGQQVLFRGSLHAAWLSTSGISPSWRKPRSSYIYSSSYSFSTLTLKLCSPNQKTRAHAHAHLSSMHSSKDPGRIRLRLVTVRHRKTHCGQFT